VICWEISLLMQEQRGWLDQRTGLLIVLLLVTQVIPLIIMVIPAVILMIIQAITEILVILVITDDMRCKTWIIIIIIIAEPVVKVLINIAIEGVDKTLTVLDPNGTAIINMLSLRANLIMEVRLKIKMDHMIAGIVAKISGILPQTLIIIIVILIMVLRPNLSLTGIWAGELHVDHVDMMEEVCHLAKTMLFVVTLI